MKKYFSKKNSAANKGFTIIETLVAITILMISIAGPLTIAQKGLSSAANTRDQVTASYLAQDLMEYIKNVRDADLLNVNTPFYRLAGCVGTSVYCNIDTAVDVPTNPTTRSCVTAADCYMYIDSNGFYRYTNSGSDTKTQFSRYANIQVIDAPTNSKYLLTVFVSWKTGTVANQIVLKDVLTNTLR
jgi:Tfp pilus assembly protein PilV